MTNNQLTDKRLVKILSETQATIMEHNSRCVRGSVEVDARLFESMIMELQERRKAAMDSEPVVFTDERNLHHIAMGRETSLIWGKQNSEAADVPLYRHAQQPVVPDEKSMPNPLSMYAVDAVSAIAEVKGWNACRAAMLQAGNSPVIPDGYVMVPEKAMTPKMIIAVQMNTELGSYAAANLVSAYRLFDEFWSEACRAAQQEVKGE